MYKTLTEFIEGDYWSKKAVYNTAFFIITS